MPEWDLRVIFSEVEENEKKSLFQLHLQWFFFILASLLSKNELIGQPPQLPLPSLIIHATNVIIH